MYIEFFYCASFKKNYQNPFSRTRDTGWLQTHKHTHTQTDNSGELDHPLEKQTRSARFARYTSDETCVWQQKDENTAKLK